MNTISQMASAGGLQQLFASSNQTQGAPPPPPRADSGSSATLQTIQGSDGQSLIDIRDQLEAAAQEAFDAHEGDGDFRADVREAIRSTLEANGFDVDEVEAAMGPKPPRGGKPPVGEGPPPSQPSDQTSFGDRFVQSFLARFSEGAHLDLVA